jgi:alcohol dehydrogenase, propanol-preferring
LKVALLRTVGKIETNPLEITEVEQPSPGTGQVLLRIDACGVCRSNLHMVEGDWVHLGVPSKFPMIPGHEIAGTVVEVGPGVVSVRRNDRIGVQPLWTACGSCEYCLTGREQLCAKREITGESVDGGYAGFMVAYEGHIYPLPSSIEPAAAAPLFCPGVTAYSAVKKAGIEPGNKVAVFGVGGVGHMAIQFARLYGAEVYAVTRGENHLSLSEELGATPIDGKDDPVEALKRIGGVDSSIVFAPSSKVAEQAIRATKAGGTIVMGAWGGFPDFPFYEEKKVVGTLMGSRQAMKEVLHLAALGKISAVTQSFKLEDANQVLRMLKEGKIKARAVLLPS